MRVGDGAVFVSSQVGPGTEGVVFLAESAFFLVVVRDRKKGLGRHAAQWRGGCVLFLLKEEAGLFYM